MKADLLLLIILDRPAISFTLMAKLQKYLEG